MSQQVLLFTATETPLSMDEAFEIVGHEAITFDETPDGGFRRMTINWEDGLSVTLSRFDDPERAELLTELERLARGLLAGRTDKKAKKVRRRAERMARVFSFTVTPDWDKGKRAQHVLQWLMESDDYAFMIANGAIYNENGNREVGGEDSPRRYFAVEEEGEDASAEAIERKTRSIAQLKKEDVPFIQHLPVIEDTSQVTLRTVPEIAQRAIALYLIAQLADGEFESEAEFFAKVDHYGARDFFTEKEQQFIADEEPTEDYILEFSQRWESLWMLLWALSYIDFPGKPNEFAFKPRMRKVLDTATVESLIADATLRPAGVILDELDLAYRYHWAVVDADLYGKRIPNGIGPAVIYERHYALNWLIGHDGAEWDTVTTDT